MASKPLVFRQPNQGAVEMRTPNGTQWPENFKALEGAVLSHGLRHCYKIMSFAQNGALWKWQYMRSRRGWKLTIDGKTQTMASTHELVAIFRSGWFALPLCN
jgi:hypothetical protein